MKRKPLSLGLKACSRRKLCGLEIRTVPYIISIAWGQGLTLKSMHKWVNLSPHNSCMEVFSRNLEAFVTLTFAVIMHCKHGATSTLYNFKRAIFVIINVFHYFTDVTMTTVITAGKPFWVTAMRMMLYCWYYIIMPIVLQSGHSWHYWELWINEYE